MKKKILMGIATLLIGTLAFINIHLEKSGNNDILVSLGAVESLAADEYPFKPTEAFKQEECSIRYPEFDGNGHVIGTIVVNGTRTACVSGSMSCTSSFCSTGN